MAAQWRVLQKKTKTNDFPSTMRSTRKHVDVVEHWLQQKLDEMKQNLSERMLDLMLVNQRLTELEKEKFISVADLQNVMAIVVSRLDKLEDDQINLVSGKELEMMTSKVVDKVVDKINAVQLVVDEKISTCLDDCAATVDEKVTMCFDGCADQFVQQTQATYNGMEKTLVAKLENAMEKMEYNLMVRFCGENLGFNEFHEQIQRKKHKPRR